MGGVAGRKNKNKNKNKIKKREKDRHTGVSSSSYEEPVLKKIRTKTDTHLQESVVALTENTFYTVTVAKQS